MLFDITLSFNRDVWKSFYTTNQSWHLSVFPKAHRFPAAGIPVKRERFEAADLPLTRQTRKESESEMRGKWKKPIHNCPRGSCKVKSVVGLAKEKVIGFRGPIGYRALSRNQPTVLGRQLLDEALRWAGVVPWGLERDLLSTKATAGSDCEPHKRAFRWKPHIISADKPKHTRADNKTAKTEAGAYNRWLVDTK